LPVAAVDERIETMQSQRRIGATASRKDIGTDAFNIFRSRAAPRTIGVFKARRESH
jgi:hypothetical protein